MEIKNIFGKTITLIKETNTTLCMVLGYDWAINLGDKV